MFLDSPVFISAPEDVLGENGERVRLGCSVASNPTPSYTWIKNDLSSEVIFADFRTFSIQRYFFTVGAMKLWNRKTTLNYLDVFILFHRK